MSTQTYSSSIRRVVVTGLGMVSPLGIGVEPSWSRLIRGECGIRSLRGKRSGIFDQLPCTIAGTIPDELFENYSKSLMVIINEYLFRSYLLSSSSWE